MWVVHRCVGVGRVCVCVCVCVFENKEKVVSASWGEEVCVCVCVCVLFVGGGVLFVRAVGICGVGECALVKVVLGWV